MALDKITSFFRSIAAAVSLDKFMSSFREIAVATVAVVGVIFLSFLCVMLIRLQIARGESVISITPSLTGCLMVGGICIYLCCMATHHAFSYWRKAHIPKAIRLSEAMQMMQAHMHHEKIDDIKRYSIRIFKTKKELPHGVTEHVDCNEIATFLSPMFLNSDRLNAFGSPYYCCDFEQVQGIIESLKAKWSAGAQSGDAAATIIALERTIADLHEKNKESISKYTAASGREGRLKKQQAEVHNHMAILVELANRVTHTVKPPKNITHDEIKAKYLAIGKIYGITEAPGEYVKIFRKSMPKDIINWGGAPSQGSDEEET